MRLKKLRQQMEKQGVRAALIAGINNVRYFSGFSGDSTQLLIMPGEALLFTDFRYTEQAEEETDFEVIETKGAARVQEIFDRAGKGKIGADFAGIMYTEYKTYLGHVASDHIIDLSDTIMAQRRIKDAGEIALIARGAKCNDALFAHLCRIIKPGMSEMDVMAEIVYYMHKHGARSAFPPIVASGENGSLPHAVPGSAKLKAGDFVTMDYGAKFGGYCSDFTRTIGISDIDKGRQKVYDIVKTAGETAQRAMKPGQKMCDIDAAAREYIASKGYGQAFGHGLGHGVGLAIHEAPSLSAASKLAMAAGMVVTVEPGIYIKSKYGVRIEDLCVITQSGCENLSSAPRELIII